MVGSLVIVLLQIFSLFWQRNNFENRLIFDDVKAYKNGANFMVLIFGPPCRRWCTTAGETSRRGGWEGSISCYGRPLCNRGTTIIFRVDFFLLFFLNILSQPSRHRFPRSFATRRAVLDTGTQQFVTYSGARWLRVLNTIYETQFEMYAFWHPKPMQTVAQ